MLCDELIKRLGELEGGQNIFRIELGICHQHLYVGTISKIWRSVTSKPLDKWFYDHLQDWKYYGNNNESSYHNSYPIQYPELSEIMAYAVVHNLWEGEYGRRRRELCGIMKQYLIDNYTRRDQ